MSSFLNELAASGIEEVSGVVAEVARAAFDKKLQEARDLIEGQDSAAAAMTSGVLDTIEDHWEDLAHVGFKGVTAALGFHAAGLSAKAEEILAFRHTAGLEDLIAASEESTAELLSRAKDRDEAAQKASDFLIAVAKNGAKAAFPFLVAVL